MLPKIIICDIDDNGIDSWNKSLYKRAIEMGYKEGENLFKEVKINKPEFIQLIKKACPEIDIIFSIQPRSLFKAPFINLARMYTVNLHLSPLPKLRGMNPASWAFADKLKKMGVSLHLVEDEGIDNGPVIFQKTFPIVSKDNVWTLFNKCIDIAEVLFEESLNKILLGKITPKKQDESKMSYHSLNEFDYHLLKIPMDKNIEDIFIFIRSRIFPPIQLPYFIYQNKYIEIIESDLKREKYRREESNKIIYQDGKYIISGHGGRIIINKHRIRKI